MGKAVFSKGFKFFIVTVLIFAFVLCDVSSSIFARDRSNEINLSILGRQEINVIKEGTAKIPERNLWCGFDLMTIYGEIKFKYHFDEYNGNVFDEIGDVNIKLTGNETCFKHRWLDERKIIDPYISDDGKKATVILRGVIENEMSFPFYMKNEQDVLYIYYLTLK